MAVLGSTLAVAFGTLILAIATWRLAKHAEHQVALQAQQLSSAQRAIVYPLAPPEWARTHERRTAGILLKNGGNGPALRVRGKVIFGGNTEAVEETTLGPGEEQVVWLRGASADRWGENVNGRLSYTDLTGEEREVLFTFETSAEGVLFVRVEHRT
jgi:hypothetical protein